MTNIIFFGTNFTERTTEGASNINTKTEIQSKSIDISVNLIASNNTLSTIHFVGGKI